MGLQKDEDQVCPTSNYYHYLENKSYVRLLGGKRSDAYTRSKSGGIIKHGTDQKKMRGAKQRGRQLTMGLRTLPYQPLHTPVPLKLQNPVTKSRLQRWDLMPEQRQHLDTQGGSLFSAKPKSVFRKMTWKVFSDMLLKRKVSLYYKGALPQL